MTLLDFSMFLGIYTAEDVGHPFFEIYLSLLKKRPLIQSELVEYFQEITNHADRSEDFSYRLVRNPMTRFYHRVLTHTICARKENLEKMSYIDLFLLYTITHQYPVDVPYFLASWLQESARGKKPGSSVGGGQYATRLIKAMGLDFASVIKGCTEMVSGMRLMSLKVLRSLGLIVKAKSGRNRNSYVWVDELPEVGPEDAMPLAHLGEGEERRDRRRRPVEQPPPDWEARFSALEERLGRIEQGNTPWHQVYREDTDYTHRQLNDMFSRMHFDYADRSGVQHTFLPPHQSWQQYYPTGGPREGPPPGGFGGDASGSGGNDGGGDDMQY